MTDMVGRVAHAIDPEAFSQTFPALAALHYKIRREIARKKALAAIEAMRDPSPSMLRAAGSAMSPGKRPTEKRVSERAKHGIRYRAMIDAALTHP